MFAGIILENEAGKQMHCLLNTAKFPETLHCPKPDLKIP
jgi:hypothetical protein